MEALFELPPKDLKKLSFCKTDKESVQLWVEGLPIADMAASTRLLYAAIQEVCRLNVSAAVRMDFIESLRPAILFACEGLKKSYLNQPVILPDQPRKIANLSQALRKYLALASVCVVIQCEAKMGSLLMKPSALFNKAVFYSLNDFKLILICNYLLYRTVEDNFWLKVHGLYQLSKSHKLDKKTIKLAASDETNGHKTHSVENGYQQIMLWGCIKANQLRQDDIKALRNTIPDWASLIVMEDAQGGLDNSLLIDPETDMPPIYRKFHKGDVSYYCTQINTADLITQLTPLADPLTRGQCELSPNLVSHLILAWSVFTDRTFMRLEANAQLGICIGLSTTHFFLGDRLPFDNLVYGKEGSPDQIHVNTSAAAIRPPSGAQVGQSQFKNDNKKKLDVWDESLYGNKAIDATTVTMESIGFHTRSGGKSKMTTAGKDKEKYQNFQVDIINMSPGGYCIEWNMETPNSIKAGEIIGIKGEHHSHWHIGVIRWVKQCAQRGLQIGVELISPSAQPYGAKFVAMSGVDKTDFLRVLLLPEIKSASQRASIITPSLSFKSGQHIHLMRNGKEETILLRELKTSTGSFSQFTFDYIQPVKNNETLDKTNPFDNFNASAPANDIDSVWELL